MAEQAGSRTIILKPSAANTANGNGNELVIPPGFKSVMILLDVTAATGTTPTLDVYLQDGVRNAAAADIEGALATGTVLFNDFAAFTQVTAVAKRYIGVIPASNFEAAAQDTALTAGSVRNGPIGQRWRVKWKIGGTTPSFSFSVVAEFRA